MLKTKILNQEDNKSKSEMKGGVTALFAEYRKAIDELKYVIKPINDKQLCEIVDKNTSNIDCKSIQSILTHVVFSGYCYIIYIENYIGNKKNRLEKITYENANEYIEQLNLMFEYSMNFFQKNTNVEIEELVDFKKINTSWGQKYDIEQLLEHAIVHVLRHRRQIEKFINQQKEIEK